MNKIKTRDVKRAAKKKNLEIKPDLTVHLDEIDAHAYSCPIGALYCQEKDIDLTNESDVNSADCDALDWAMKKFGKYYTDGFIRGFDYGWYKNAEEYLEDYLFDESKFKKFNSRAKKNYREGFANGRLLRKTLVGDV